MREIGKARGAQLAALGTGVALAIAGVSHGTNTVHVNNAVLEVERYADQFLKLLGDVPDNVLWQKPDTIANSIGALARHLAGNLNHYLGSGVLDNGYKREREQEFHAEPISREVLIADLKAAVAVARAAAGAIDDKRAREPHTTPCGQEFESLAEHVARIATHFAYHVGEAYYASKLLKNG